MGGGQGNHRNSTHQGWNPAPCNLENCVCSCAEWARDDASKHHPWGPMHVGGWRHPPGSFLVRTTLSLTVQMKPLSTPQHCNHLDRQHVPATAQARGPLGSRYPTFQFNSIQLQFNFNFNPTLTLPAQWAIDGGRPFYLGIDLFPAAYAAGRSRTADCVLRRCPLGRSQAPGAVSHPKSTSTVLGSVQRCPVHNPRVPTTPPQHRH